jgi:hypothetical protein
VLLLNTTAPPTWLMQLCKPVVVQGLEYVGLLQLLVAHAAGSLSKH